MITAKQFVKIWQSSKNIKEVSKKCGGSAIGTVAARACYYRRLGVNLKKFKSGRPASSIDELNIAIQKLR